jgi:hypothetical protein
LVLEGVVLGEEDVEELASAPNLKSLILDVHGIRGNPENTLSRLSELPIAHFHLTLEGDWFDDELASDLRPESQINGLAIKSSRISDRTFRQLSEMKSLERIWIERSPVRAADFSPLAKAPKLKEAIFYRCNLSQRDEDNLLKLWPDGNLHTGTGPDGKSRLVQLFRVQQHASVDQGAGP